MHVIVFTLDLTGIVVSVLSGISFLT